MEDFGYCHCARRSSSSIEVPSPVSRLSSSPPSVLPSLPQATGQLPSTGRAPAPTRHWQGACSPGFRAVPSARNGLGSRRSKAGQPLYSVCPPASPAFPSTTLVILVTSGSVSALLRQALDPTGPELHLSDLQAPPVARVANLPSSWPGCPSSGTTTTTLTPCFLQPAKPASRRPLTCPRPSTYNP